MACLTRSRTREEAEREEIGDQRGRKRIGSSVVQKFKTATILTADFFF